MVKWTHAPSAKKFGIYCEHASGEQSDTRACFDPGRTRPKVKTCKTHPHLNWLSLRHTERINLEAERHNFQRYCPFPLENQPSHSPAMLKQTALSQSSTPLAACTSDEWSDWTGNSRSECCVRAPVGPWKVTFGRAFDHFENKSCNEYCRAVMPKI